MFGIQLSYRTLGGLRCPSPVRRRRRHAPAKTEPLEVRRLLTGDYVAAFAIGGTSTEEVASVAVDSSGNVYATGYFHGTVDFDPGPGITLRTSAGDKDIFIAKYNSAGALLWAHRIGGIEADEANEVVVDPTGNAIVVGRFRRAMDIDPGATQQLKISNGESDVFVTKFSSAGNLVWGHTVGGLLDDVAYDVALDGSGRVHVAGWYSSTADFDPGTGINVMQNTTNTANTFVLKLSSAGSYLWARNAGSTGDDKAYGIAVDGGGNVFIAGQFSDTADFDPSASTLNLTSVGWRDAFIWKLTATGNLSFAHRFGSSGNQDQAIGIAVDTFGNVVTTGRFGGTVDFDPGAGTTVLTGGSADIFISKFSNDGSYFWARNFSTLTFMESPHAVTTDLAGGIYVAGEFTDIIDFDPSVNVAQAVGHGLSDAFVVKFDAFGNYNWHTAVGAGQNDRARDVALEPDGSRLRLSGSFRLTTDFDPDAATANLTAGNNGFSTDGFVGRYTTGFSQQFNASAAANLFGQSTNRSLFEEFDRFFDKWH